MYGYIYKITNLINGKIYIGQHKHNRLDNSYLGGGVKLRNAFKKYGKKNFVKEILEECETWEMLNEREIYYIALYDSTNPEIGYNLEFGGNQSPANEETRKKLSKALKGKMKGRKMPPVTEETRKKLSIALKGKPSKRKGRKFGHITEEHRRKLIEHSGQRGAIWSEERRRHLSEGQKKRFQEHPEHRQQIVEFNRDRIAIHKGDMDKNIKKYELDIYLAEGWEIGFSQRRKEIAVRNIKPFFPKALFIHEKI